MRKPLSQVRAELAPEEFRAIEDFRSSRRGEGGEQRWSATAFQELRDLEADYEWAARSELQRDEAYAVRGMFVRTDGSIDLEERRLSSAQIGVVRMEMETGDDAFVDPDTRGRLVVGITVESKAAEIGSAVDDQDAAESIQIERVARGRGQNSIEMIETIAAMAIAYPPSKYPNGIPTVEQGTRHGDGSISAQIAPILVHEPSPSRASLEMVKARVKRLRIRVTDAGMRDIARLSRELGVRQVIERLRRECTLRGLIFSED